MISITSDNFPLWLALASAVASLVFYIASMIISKNEYAAIRVQRVARVLYIVSLAACAWVTAYLLQQILSGQRYDIDYIARYSGPGDELLYKISALWAGQEGSLLVWAMLGAIIGLPFVLRKGRIVPAILCGVQIFLLALLVGGDPFATRAGYAPGMIGSGLNPLLKNPWMAIHPPIVFLGYALSAIPAALALDCLIRGDAKSLIKLTPWAVASWLALTAGIALGMIWSYEVLGWGGYWSWDPVENASLVPWLISTALVHGLIVQKRTGSLARTNVILALGAFLLVLYATFLTRSGVLQDISVHSFEKPGSSVSALLLGYLIFFLVISIMMVAIRWKKFASNAHSSNIELAAGIGVLAVLAGIVLIGTSYPIINQAKSWLDSLFSGSVDSPKPADILQPRFYTHLSAPLAAVMAALIALVSSRTRRKALVAIGIVIGISMIAFIFATIAPDASREVFNWLPSESGPIYPQSVSILIAMIGTSLFALVMSINLWRRNTGAAIAHMGVALAILGIIFSSSGNSRTLALEKDGVPESAFGHSFSYSGIKNTGIDSDDIRLTMSQNGRQKNLTLPLEYSSDSVVSRPKILSNPVRDLYIAFGGIRSTTVTATASMSGENWLALPVNIPESDATLTLVGMQVENDSVTLRYSAPNRKPIDIAVSKSKPANIDGYTLTFGKFVSSGSMGESLTAGINIIVTGRNLTDKLIIKVSRRPLISLLWLGCVFMIAGGAIALRKRAMEKNGILPDSD